MVLKNLWCVLRQYSQKLIPDRMIASNKVIKYELCYDLGNKSAVRP